MLSTVHRQTPENRSNSPRWSYPGSGGQTENSFPADSFHVPLYLQHLIEQSQSSSLIDSSFYGIKWAHDLMI